MNGAKTTSDPAPPASHWLGRKGSALVFAVDFALFAAAFGVVRLFPFWDGWIEAHSRWNAHLASGALKFLGELTQTSGTLLFSDRFSLTVAPSCSAQDFIVFYAAAIFALPGPLLRKAGAVGVGSLVLVGLNLARICALYAIGAHWPSSFDQAHVTWLPALMIVATMVICLGALRWVLPTREEAPPQ